MDDSQPIEIFDPQYTWKRKMLEDVRAEELLVPIFKSGKQVYTLPALEDIKRRCSEQLATMWEEVLRFENPHNYYVDLSQKLWDIKHEMIRGNR